MAYFVNKTDGNAIVVLDGTKDTTSTSLTLIGKLAQTYGESQNENFLHLLENFAFNNPPANPINGQIWFDTSVNALKVYEDNIRWVEIGSKVNGSATIAGNLNIGGALRIDSFPFVFQRESGSGQVVFLNDLNNTGYAIKSNLGGAITTVANIHPNTGLLTVVGNATANFGVTTKIYVDSATANLQSAINTLTSSVNSLNSNVSSIQSGGGSVSAITLDTQSLSLNGSNVMYSSGVGNTIVNFQTPQGFTFLSAYGTNPSNLVTVSGSWILNSGATLNSSYADLAEYYSSDREYEPGTVVIFGGTKEVTVTKLENDKRVAGIVSTNPGYIMNESLKGTRICLALQGRTPCKVIGPINKGDLLTTSTVEGHAVVAPNPQIGTILGKALEDLDVSGPGIVEVAVGRM